MLSLDWSILWTVINVIVTYFLLKKFLFKPVTAIMQERRDTIDSQFASAKEKEEAAEAKLIEYEESLRGAKEEAHNIISQARQQAQRQQEVIIAKAREEASKVVSQANKTAELEREQTMQDVQAEIASLALAAASKIMEKDMDNDSNSRLMNDFLSEAGACNDTASK